MNELRYPAFLINARLCTYVVMSWRRGHRCTVNSDSSPAVAEI